MEIYRSVGVADLVALMAADREAQGQSASLDTQRSPAALIPAKAEGLWNSAHWEVKKEQPVS